MLRLRLKKLPFPRVLRGHPWVFASEVQELLPQEANGSTVELFDARNRLLGTGIYNGLSQIVWRRISYTPVPQLDKDFFLSAIGAALTRRPKDMAVGRLVWSEADYLPGLVVDRFESTLVVQTLTLAMDKALAPICEALKELFSPEEIILRNDAPSRRYEGLKPLVQTLSGRPWPARWIEIEGIAYWLDLPGAQKTGFFLDQRFQHLNVARYAKGRRVLDGFCNQGGFALQCAKAGAKASLAIDISADCVSATARNAQYNALNVETVQSNMFDWFTANRDRQFDLIILDPPSFARGRQAVQGALRGYKELNLRALRMLSAGGILATYSCSHGVSEDAFFGALADAAADSHRSVRLLERTGQPFDHPVLLNMPESQYLKGLIISVD